MRIISVTINELFGFYNYKLTLNNDITIIHGPNGCGKTTMLKIINAVFNKDILFLKTANYGDIVIEFDNGNKLGIKKKKLDLNDDKEDYLEYYIENRGKKQKYNILYDKNKKYFYKNYIQNTLLKEDYYKLISNKLSEEEMENFLFTNGNNNNLIPEEINEILNKVDVRLIAADRLTVHKKVERNYGGDELKVEQKVAVLANDISKKIKESIQKYAQISQSKDRTFPLRVIKAVDPLPIETIKNKMIDLEKKRKQFVESGILEEERDVNIHELVNAITEDNRQTLSLYAIDTEEKLNALAELSESINLFRMLIDKKFSNKKIIFNKEYGFSFVTSYSNAVVIPENLSSGEQHELVMFYDLIFNTSSDTLILIDEPELSLHIKWQLEYIDDLSKIVNVSGLRALIATHSPQIIHDNWNLTIKLAKEG